MKKLQCTCCGGSIDVKTMRCEYCGTQYKLDEYAQLLRIETYTQPVETLKTACIISRREVEAIGTEAAGEIMTHEMCRRIAEALRPYVKLEATQDYETDTIRAYGTIKVVRPI